MKAAPKKNQEEVNYSKQGTLFWRKSYCQQNSHYAAYLSCVNFSGPLTYTDFSGGIEWWCSTLVAYLT